MLVRRAAQFYACVCLLGFVDSAVRKNHWTFIANAFYWYAQSTKNGGLFSPISKYADDMNENDFLFREKNEGR